MLAADDERVRRMAAKDLLDYSFKILEGRDVLDRLAAIENKLAEKKP
jgi:hypothetical protein